MFAFNLYTGIFNFPCSCAEEAAFLQVMILASLISVSSDLGLFLGLTLLFETEVLPAALRRLSFFI